MTSSASTANHIAVVLVGIILAGLSAAVVGWLWQGMGLPVFIIFLVSWSIERINTIALERRHPELILSPGWRRVKVRYRPLQLADDEYEVSLTEFILGQIVLVLLGLPVALFVAGLVGLLSSEIRWPVVFVVFGVWAALMLAGIVSAIQRR
jgi:hypothetical protein